MPRSAILPSAGKRGMNMNFDHEELTLMMLYNTGTRTSCGLCSAT